MTNFGYYIIFLVTLQRLGLPTIEIKYQRPEPTRRIGPFLDKRKIGNAVSCLNKNDHTLLTDIDSLCLLNENIVREQVFLSKDILLKILDHPGLLVKNGEKNSARRIDKKTKNRLLSFGNFEKIAEKGKIDKGIIHMADSECIRIYWKYHNVNLPILNLPSNDIFEYICTDDGEWQIRDKILEQKWLSESNFTQFSDIPFSARERISDESIFISKDRWKVLYNDKQVEIDFDLQNKITSGLFQPSIFFEGKTDNEIDKIVSAYLADRRQLLHNGKVVFLSNPLSKLISNTDLIRGLGKSINIPIEKILSISKKFSELQHHKIEYTIQSLGFVGKLKEYQRDGVLWLNQLKEIGLGAVLADEMGLGKTVMIIAYLLSTSQNKISLIVCPKTLVGNWTNEISRFAPDCFRIITSISQNEIITKKQLSF